MVCSVSSSGCLFVYLYFLSPTIMADYLKLSSVSKHISKGSSSSLSSSSSLEALRTASSHHSHQQSRNLAKLAVDSLNVAAAVRKGFTHDDSQKGVKSDTIKGDIGDDEFDALCKDGRLGLVTINYCQRGLEHLGERLNKEKLKTDSGKKDLSDADVDAIEEMKARAVINHDYLVLELQPGDSPSKKFYILAEKLGMGGRFGKPGIYISYKTAEQAESFLLNDRTKLYAVKCGQSTHIPLKEILEILKDVNPDYSLRNANCWDYATKTAKKLALKCAEAAGISAQEKARLTREYKNFEANLNEKNMCNVGKTVMAWISSKTGSVINS